MRQSWARLEEQTGRPLDPALRASIDDLNATPGSIVEEARRVVSQLGRMAGFEYLSYVATDANWEYLSTFLEDVVEKGGDPATWRVGTSFCYPRFDDVQELLVTPMGAIQGRFGALANAPWFHVVPARQDPREHFVGAPGVLIDPVTYRWKRLPGLAHVKWSPMSVAPELAPAADLAVALARWMALRVAVRMGASPYSSDAEILTALGVDASSLSDLGRAAIAGLVREHRELGAPSDGDVPGFRGPDEWFKIGGVA